MVAKKNIYPINAIYGDMTEDKTLELPDFIVDIVAQLIQQYVHEDNLKNGDATLDDLMELGELFSRKYYQSIVHCHRLADPNKIESWKLSIAPALDQHLSDYSVLYKNIFHLNEEYGVALFMLVYLVESVLELKKAPRGRKFKGYFNRLSQGEKDYFYYLVRFCDNVLIDVYGKLKQQQ